MRDNRTTKAGGLTAALTAALLTPAAASGQSGVARVLGRLPAVWLGALFVVAAASAQTQLIDFEDFDVGAALFEQVPGIRFPGTPRITVPDRGTASGTQALTTRRPGAEFDAGPLVVEFLAPQRFVRLRAGIDTRSDTPRPATLRAFDGSGRVVGTRGPIMIGPGPTGITTPMEIELSRPAIRRIELQIDIAFFEVIDDLEFSRAGPRPPPDTVAPRVTLLQPAEGAVVTGRSFILEAAIVEDRLLREVRLEIANERAIISGPTSFGGVAPDFSIAPRRTSPLAPGSNTITLVAEDFGGNTGQASVTIERADIGGRLVLPEGPIEIPRASSTAIAVRLEETFPGSLDGRELLTIETITEDVVGRAVLRDPLNDREPVVTLDLAAEVRAELGPRLLTVRVLDEISGRVLDVATVPASIVPADPVDCAENAIATYATIPRASLERDLNGAVDLQLSGNGTVVAADDDDIGTRLLAFSGPERYHDADDSGTLDPGEPIYADVRDLGEVSAGDIRLTNAPVVPDGSVVAARDADVGNRLIAFERGERFVDFNGNGGLDGRLREAVYRDRDESRTVTIGDERLADSFIVPPLRKLEDLTVEYLHDPFGTGKLRIAGRFRAGGGGFFQGDVRFIGDLRVGLVGTNVDFRYTFQFIRADPTGGPFDPLIAGKIEDAFRARFANPLRAGLGPAIDARIDAEQPGARLFLREAFITRREFGLGFCVPPAQFPSPDP